ncbi:acyl-CoA dehydrogenase family protein [Actinokineospora sp. NBRC 105648]|uniref:acyl-CoA dehydrogenase family protein n=1 Tax=Actinokineospora sp. NBRC 105648 TaxID=3032206 RepID=UPI0024A0B96A|nr:acyl-CoA dehydrogenase family protein [Actinokineospora sp. NBRC 105648]GLZ42029.1 hydroxylase [Actinokineospora sp. NBRC 105648]
MTAVALDPVGAARALAADLAAGALEVERARRLPPALVTRLRAAGLFTLGLPRSLGGLESPAGQIIDAVEAVARADASVGWAVLIGNTSAFLAWLDPAVAKTFTAGPTGTVLAGSMAPSARGEVVDGGAAYRVTGRWAFASGCTHADVVMGGFVVTEDGVPGRTAHGAPLLRVAFLRADQVEVHDTWRVAGLAGTGSHDISVADVVVPAEHTAVPFAERSVEPGALYRLTPYTVLMVLFAGFPLGVAGRALDELESLAGTKRRVGSGRPLIEDPGVATAVVADRAALDAAGLLVRDRAERVWARVAAGGEPTPAERADLASATLHAFDVGREVVSRCFTAAGASALAEDAPLQRCLRDLHAAGQHIAFSADSRIRVARTRLGLVVPPAMFAV